MIRPSVNDDRFNIIAKRLEFIFPPATAEDDNVVYAADYVQDNSTYRDDVCAHPECLHHRNRQLNKEPISILFSHFRLGYVKLAFMIEENGEKYMLHNGDSHGSSIFKEHEFSTKLLDYGCIRNYVIYILHCSVKYDYPFLSTNDINGAIDQINESSTHVYDIFNNLFVKNGKIQYTFFDDSIVYMSSTTRAELVRMNLFREPSFFSGGRNRFVKMTHDPFTEYMKDIMDGLVVRDHVDVV